MTFHYPFSQEFEVEIIVHYFTGLSPHSVPPLGKKKKGIKLLSFMTFFGVKFEFGAVQFRNATCGNGCNVQMGFILSWDIWNREGLPTGEPERLRKYFGQADLGRISEPATIVDRHGKIVTMYLPNILSPSRVVRLFII
jgi:hypothetical protein